MRHKILFIITIIVLSFSKFTVAQSDLSTKIFSNTQGIRFPEFTTYEVEGYTIYSKIINAKLDGAAFKKTKKRLGIPKELLPTSDSSLGVDNRVFFMENKVSENVSVKTLNYFIKKGDNEIKIITLITDGSREPELENLFVKSIIEKTIPKEVYITTEMDSISFVGRKIILGNVCSWRDVHNLQCPDFGQMNWSECRTLIRAKELLTNQHEIIVNKKNGEVLKEDSLKIIFEGNEISALKTTYKFKVPQLIMGGSNILIIYFVATEVRNKYISCVLSHYTDDYNFHTLPPLLNEVMKLK